MVVGQLKVGPGLGFGDLLAADDLDDLLILRDSSNDVSPAEGVLVAVESDRAGEDVGEDLDVGRVLLGRASGELLWADETPPGATFTLLCWGTDLGAKG